MQNKTIVAATSIFEKDFKRLNRRYPSLPTDIEELKKSLEEDPFQGDKIGHNIRKVRLAIKSKGRGKSGGARVITFFILDIKSTNQLLLVTMFDKNEMENISDTLINQIIKDTGF